MKRYETYLKAKAEEVAPSRRLRAGYDVMFPWLVPILLISVVAEVFNFGRDLRLAIVLPIALIGGAGGAYAAMRIAIYGMRADRRRAGASSDAPSTVSL